MQLDSQRAEALRRTFSDDSSPELSDHRFAAEKEIICRLFEPIRQIITEDSRDDRSNRGNRLYDEWGKMRRKECLLSYYDSIYFRAQYARHRFCVSACSFLQAIYKVMEDFPSAETYLKERINSVVSVGVGPGSDIAGLLSYRHARKIKKRLVYFTVDQCNDWSKYLTSMDKKLGHEFALSLWFKQMRFGKLDTVPLLPDADLLVFSFSNTALMDSMIWPELQKRYRLILVLDGIKEILQDGFGDSGFIQYQLNERTALYYAYSAPPDLIEIDEKAKAAREEAERVRKEEEENEKKKKEAKVEEKDETLNGKDNHPEETTAGKLNGEDKTEEVSGQSNVL